MKIKKYVANSMPEAMNQIRKELGPDAVILNSKEILQGGFLGLFKKRKIEVVAVHDPDPFQQVNQKSSNDKTPVLQKEREKPQAHVEQGDVLIELKQLKRLIQSQALNSKDAFPPDFNIVYQYLLKQEVSEDYAAEIMQSVVEDSKNMQEISIQDIVVKTKREIVKRLRSHTFSGIQDDKKIIHFVGPTGVGKTTTLAKVAGNSMLQDNKKIAFITMDTYRIAAIEQLKTYAEILQVPIKVAYSAQDYVQALDEFAAYDLILVDTAGRNFRDERYIEELKKNMSVEHNTEVYLVLSLTAKLTDLSAIKDKFATIPVKEFIFTKLDETRQYGGLLTLMLESGKGIGYMTNGQSVPDDVLQPTAEQIAELIMGDFFHE
ncbi:flagellar biosynthesis protein FlhF [Virgibacillus soli]|uniref:flagellar biosynthesis protein FlhF n=1 Tax=Paracerasibacillus soli TaxID=480284 RepID=UPI0035EEAB90